MALPVPQADSKPSPHTWHEANESVAAFPRGHADILAWETREGTKPPTAGIPRRAMPGHAHQDHHGSHEVRGGKPGNPPHHPSEAGSKP
ncbi:hypothetical protein IB243_00345 [Acidovorax sp. ACV01]|nr:hypothetical protein [Acidovorax sp. ACV01]